jgi:hypothetical protein
LCQSKVRRGHAGSAKNSGVRQNPATIAYNENARFLADFAVTAKKY